MRDKVTEPHAIDRRIGAIAGRQRGLIRVDQLIACGLGRNGISHRVGAGRLVRVQRGVYAVGHAAPSRAADFMAAVLYAGVGSALSHASLAEFLGVWRHPIDDVIHVVSPRHHRSPVGVCVHQSRSLTPSDVTVVGGMPVTTLPRLLLDLGDQLTPHQLAFVMYRLAYSHRLDPEELRATAERGVGRRAGVMLRAAIELHGSGSAGTRSLLEDRFLALLLVNGVETPLINVQVKIAGSRITVLKRRKRELGEGEYELDEYWPHRALCVEVDGSGHARPIARRNDRERDEALDGAGVQLLRVTERQVRAAERSRRLPPALRTIFCT